MDPATTTGVVEKVQTALTARLTDEQGKPSMARVLLIVWTALAVASVIAAVWHDARPDNAVWTLLGSVELYLVAWTAGPRMAQYIAPQIGAAAVAIGRAFRSQTVNQDDR